MAFGLSGSQTGTLMDNGDVTVAWVDDMARAEDYFLKARSPVRELSNIIAVYSEHVILSIAVF